MPWLVQGNCNHCGACCKPPVVVDNPCFDVGDTECLFFGLVYDTSDRFGNCLIYQRSGNKMNAQDKNGVRITQEQYDWWVANCQPYPVLIDHMPENVGGHGTALPPTCAYTITEVP